MALFGCNPLSSCHDRILWPADRDPEWQTHLHICRTSPCRDETWTQLCHPNLGTSAPCGSAPDSVNMRIQAPQTETSHLYLHLLLKILIGSKWVLCIAVPVPRFRTAGICRGITWGPSVDPVYSHLISESHTPKLPSALAMQCVLKEMHNYYHGRF